ncbi:MAG: DUF4270 family protein [Bacteroidota bacterium]
MNLWARKKWLLLLNVIAVFVISCEDDFSNTGFDTENDNFEVFFSEVDIPTSVVWLDSINTRNSGRLLAGSYTDPLFGSVSAEGYSQLFLSSTTLPQSIDETAAFDSIVLHLRVQYFYGNQIETPQNFAVYRLNESITDSSTVFTFHDAQRGEKLGETTFTLQPDSVDRVFQAADTTIVNSFDTNGRFIYLMDVKLNNSFGLEIFNQALNDSTADNFLTDRDDFENFIPGISVVNEGTEGALLGFNISDANSQMTLYYSEIDSEGNRVQREFDFNLNTSTFGQIALNHFNRITPNRLESNRSGTALADLNSFNTSFEPAGDLAYVQAGGSVVTKLDLSSFSEDAFIDTLDNAILNSAQIILNDAQDIQQGLEPPGSIGVLLADENNRLVGGGISIILDDFSAIVNYDTASRGYNIPVTIFLQNILDRNDSTQQVFIVPSQFGASVNRFITEKENIKLRFFYTRPK